MNKRHQTAIEQANFTRYSPNSRAARAGHYESFFQRANHPTRPLAFWIRYTIFSPNKRVEDAIGELWAIYFDGVSGEHVAVKTELPMSECTFSRFGLSVRVGESTLKPGALVGAAQARGNAIEWTLGFSGDSQPI